MARPSKSQWDFGELFPAEALRKVLSVAELTASIRRVLESQVGEVWVTGEITNRRLQSSGHIYFTLKDASAQVACVLFRTESGINRELVEDGRHVTVRAQINVYEPRGQYQLKVTAVEGKGEGALRAAFENLKKQLQAEGLFDQQRKRSLPRCPSRIGLITSPTGAAVRDVLHVAQRRNPTMEFVFVPCRVQGTGAAREIALALALLNEYHAAEAERGNPGLDLIVLTRGGGSLEDLWAFNEVEVARAIYDSGLPVVSAVGHEIDFTISDFVADLRAATPSAAAEIITEGIYSRCQELNQYGSQMRFLVGEWLEHHAGAVERTLRRLQRVHPRRLLENRLQRIDESQGRLERALRQALRQAVSSHKTLVVRLGALRPRRLLIRRRERLLQTSHRMREQAITSFKRQQSRHQSLADRLRLLGPDQVLARGYSITRDAHTGAILRRAAQAVPGQPIATRLASGEIISIVK